MATTLTPLSLPRSQASGIFRAVVFGLAIGIGAPLFADTPGHALHMIGKGRYVQALEVVDSQLAANPNDPQARFFKGIIYSETHRDDEAIAVYVKLTEDYPEYAEPYNNLAVIYARNKQYEQARMALAMAIQANPSYATAYENLGDLYAKLANQAYAKAGQLDGASKSVAGKLALSRELIEPPTKPVPASASNKAGAQ